MWSNGQRESAARCCFPIWKPGDCELRGRERRRRPVVGGSVHLASHGCLYTSTSARCRQDLRDAALFSGAGKYIYLYTSSNLLLVTVQINKLYKKPSIFSPKWRYASRTKCPLSFVKKMNSEAPITSEYMFLSFWNLGVVSGREPVLCRLERSLSLGNHVNRGSRQLTISGPCCACKTELLSIICPALMLFIRLLLSRNPSP